jgi:hypothetical protein
LGLALAIPTFQILLCYSAMQRDKKALPESIAIAVLLCCEGSRDDL